MIPASDRKLAVELIDEAIQNGARQFMACHELKISERTYTRWKNPSTPLEDRRPGALRPTPANKLSAEERQEIIAIVTSEKFQSLPPSQIVPRLADEEKRYIASESTMYRILKEANMNHHRGRSLKPQKRPITSHKATGPNQVWMWDITWLPGPVKGFHYYLYLILDLYSRKIVGWEIWPEESSENASILVRKAVFSENLISRKQPLVLHSDNGSPMKGVSLMETLNKLGITSSKSRPRVSNDNPYAESIFRTCKYRPDYPYKGFESIAAARQWVFEFARYYNCEHCHSGLNFLTPNQRHIGMDQTVFSNRTAVYEAAREKHPNRWSKEIRNWSLETEVWLNPEKDDQDASAKSTG
jgi:putative transposase